MDREPVWCVPTANPPHLAGPTKLFIPILQREEMEGHRGRMSLEKVTETVG